MKSLAFLSVLLLAGCERYQMAVVDHHDEYQRSDIVILDRLDGDIRIVRCLHALGDCVMNPWQDN